MKASTASSNVAAKTGSAGALLGVAGAGGVIAASASAESKSVVAATVAAALVVCFADGADDGGVGEFAAGCTAPAWPAGGNTCTIMLQRGQAMICPIIDSLRTVSTARQLTQVILNGSTRKSRSTLFQRARHAAGRRAVSRTATRSGRAAEPLGGADP